MNTFNTRLLLALLASSVSMCGGDDAPDKKAIQEPCVGDDECESGKCLYDYLESLSFCSEACTNVGESCDAGTDLICGTDMYCRSRCQDGSPGPNTSICVGGVNVECESADPALTCKVCGCDTQGGGVCVEGMGCLQPVGVGMPCLNDEMCIDGVCDPESKVCSALRPIGEPCFFDKQCDTKNCSNDGATGSMGVCNQKLGSYCQTNGAEDSPTCTRCVGRWVAGTGTVGTCRRADCDEVEAECGKGWECMSTREGGSACFQTCENSSLCEEEFATCQGEGPYAICL